MKDIHDLINEGPIFLINEYEDAVFRARYDESGKLEIYTKIKGKPEFSSPNSGIFKDVFSIHYLISKEEYEKY